jgi:hypothetical protein
MLRSSEMIGHAGARTLPLPAATGLAVGCAGIGFIGAGLWGRREARRALARERVVSSDARAQNKLVASATRARSMAELIRRNTVEATGGRTYTEIDPYVDAGGNTTPDAERAAKDERTGEPIENPDHALWIQSTTLQTALMQAYMAFRLTDLTVALGASFVAVGIGLAAMSRRLRPALPGRES